MLDPPGTELLAAVLDDFGDEVERKLAEINLHKSLSPVHEALNVISFRDRNQILLGLVSSSALAQVVWHNRPTMEISRGDLATILHEKFGRTPAMIVSLPLPDDPEREAKIILAASQHVQEVERMNAIAKLGDISHVRHLEPYLKAFLDDNPDPDRNVFIMMRFGGSEQLAQVHKAIIETLREQGMNPVRADDRDYTGELWSNVEVYLNGCKYGIAVFEDVDYREFNPNVSLELGYFMGRGKRTLLLKEKRLPQLPSDVVHRLYKTFDIFHIESSIAREVTRWVNIDLGVG